MYLPCFGAICIIYVYLIFFEIFVFAQFRDGNGYPLPAYPVGKNPIRVRVWDKKLPMGT